MQEKQFYSNKIYLCIEENKVKKNLNSCRIYSMHIA